MATRYPPNTTGSSGAGPGLTGQGTQTLEQRYGIPPPPSSGGGGGGGILGTVGGATTTAGMATANPYLVGAGLVMQAGQMGLDVYGGYKEQQKQEQAMREYKAEQERQRRIEEEQRQYQRYLDRLAQSQNIGQYSQGLEDRSLDRYSQYVT